MHGCPGFAYAGREVKYGSTVTFREKGKEFVDGSALVSKQAVGGRNEVGCGRKSRSQTFLNQPEEVSETPDFGF